MRDENEIVAELQTAVEEFNQKLSAWQAKSGCVVNFHWHYNDDNGTAEKFLQIQSIDRIIYRKPPPSREQMMAALSEMAQKS